MFKIIDISRTEREPMHERWLNRGRGPRITWGPPKKAHINFWPSGESIWQNLTDRWNRPYHAYRTLFDQIPELAELPKGALRWSQKAGCPCGCSPAFIDTSNTLKENIHVTFTMEED